MFSSPQQIETTRRVAQKYLPTPPKTLQDYVNRFDKNLIEEAKKASIRMRYPEAQNIISRYNSYNTRGLQTFSDIPTEEEIETVKDSYLKITKRAFKETRRDSPDEKELKKNIAESIAKFTRGFSLSIKGSRTNGPTGISTLDDKAEEEALDRRSRLEILRGTVSNIGDKYKFYLDGEWDFDPEERTLKGATQGIVTNASLINFNLFGQDFYRLKAEAKSNQEFRSSLIKLHGCGVYTTATIKYDCVPVDFSSASFSVSREWSEPGVHISRASLSLIYNNKTQEDEIKIGASILKLF